jgi:sulfate transport system substrate-binding protein
MKKINLSLGLLLGLTAASWLYAQEAPAGKAGSEIKILNVSYDPTREFYADYDQVFADYWKKKTGQDVTVDLSNGGSGKQARAIIDGLEADVATLGLSGDIDAIASKAQLLPDDWESRLPDHSAPYTSTIVLLVRKGNPKAIKNWDDLVKPGVAVITPNPKTSGGGRWNFLAAWGWALSKYGTEDQAREFVGKIYKNVPVLDSGARGSTTTFVERGLGDVLIAWENEAYLAVNQLGKDQLEIVYPSSSILAEPSVAWVDKNTEKHGTTEVAQAYLKYLYTPEGQDVIARNYYRPRSKKVEEKYRGRFPAIKLFTVNKVFGGWKKAQPAYFNDGGVFDQIYQPK